MPVFQVSDGTRLYYKDWGEGAAVVFSHGWPLNSDMWEAQMMYLASRGYRVVAHDRRAVTACATTDCRDDIARFDVPVLIVHGEDDAFVPFSATAQQGAELFPNAELKVYRRAPHAILYTHADRLNEDLLEFVAA